MVAGWTAAVAVATVHPSSFDTQSLDRDVLDGGRP